MNNVKMQARAINGLSAIAPHFQGILCDVWGVLHNGKQAIPNAAHALCNYRKNFGNPVVLITNSPRSAQQIAHHLASLGIPTEAYDAIITSGDTVRDLLSQKDVPNIFHIGPHRHQNFFEKIECNSTDANQADLIVCTGLRDRENENPEHYRQQFAEYISLGLTMICANPDIVSEHGDKLVWCAGSLARLYNEMGGQVLTTGKPNPPIYQSALRQLENLSNTKLPTNRILAIGDGLFTDIKGANAKGLGTLFLSGGIHASEWQVEEKDFMPSLHIRLEQEGLEVQSVMRRLHW